MPSSVDPEVKEPTKKAGQHEPLNVTEHSVSNDFDFPDDFSVDTLPGMLFYQIIDKSAQERHVIAWWKSREAFEAWRKQFAKLLGWQFKDRLDRLETQAKRFLRISFLAGRTRTGL